MKKLTLLFLLMSATVASARTSEISAAGYGTGFSEASACAMAEFDAQGSAQAQCRDEDSQGTVTSLSCSNVSYPSGHNMYTCHANCTAICEL